MLPIADDNTGNVTLIPTADNAINFHVIFSEGAQPVVVGNGLQAKNRYTTPWRIPTTGASYCLW